VGSVCWKWGRLGKARSRSGVDNVYEEGSALRIGRNQALVIELTTIGCD
jgi:hypothetical protein